MYVIVDDNALQSIIMYARARQASELQDLLATF